MHGEVQHAVDFGTRLAQPQSLSWFACPADWILYLPLSIQPGLRAAAEPLPLTGRHRPLPGHHRLPGERRLGRGDRRWRHACDSGSALLALQLPVRLAACRVSHPVSRTGPGNTCQSAGRSRPCLPSTACSCSCTRSFPGSSPGDTHRPVAQQLCTAGGCDTDYRVK